MPLTLVRVHRHPIGMPLLGPTPDDLRKLHAEATQIVNQKFLVTTASITVFGVLSAQMLSAQMLGAGASAGAGAGGAGAGGAVALGWGGFLGPSLLCLVLLVLFLYSTILAGMLRVITTYLVETGASSWETDWAAYRRGGHLGYTRAQALVFLFLTVISAGYPWAFSAVRGMSLGPDAAAVMHGVVSITSVLAIVSLGLLGWPDLEKQPDRRWRAMLGVRREPAERGGSGEGAARGAQRGVVGMAGTAGASAVST